VFYSRDVKLLLVRRSSRYNEDLGQICLAANGTAIEGVCVTGEAIRPVVPVVSKERVPVASRYGAIFAITVRVGYCAIAVQGDG
jgi:hypothetical protein